MALLRILVAATALAAPGAVTNPHPNLGGYTPASNVVEHAQVFKDVKDITTAVNMFDFATASQIWNNGKHSCKGVTKPRTLQGFVGNDAVEYKLTGQAFFDSFTNGTGPSKDEGPIPGPGRLNLGKDFWDKFVSDALAGNGDFQGKSKKMRRVAVAKGVLGVITMYTARELESAISKAVAGKTQDKDGAPHAWDEGWAFYYGSHKNDADKYDGKYSAWEFTKKRDLDFAWKSNKRVPDTVEGKEDILAHFLEGLKASRTDTKNISQMVASRDNIYRILALSSIRAALKYAYKTQANGYKEDYHMEAYTYFLAAAGWVAQANSTAANTTLGLLDFRKSEADLDSDLYCAVKAALIPAYKPLGLDCQKVGKYKDLPDDKSCSSPLECPLTEALPQGLDNYIPNTATTAGSNIDCTPISRAYKTSMLLVSILAPFSVLATAR